MHSLWQEKIKAGSRQCQLTDVGSSSVGNLDVNYDPGQICCMYYKKGLEGATRLTRENCKPQAALLFLGHNCLKPSRMSLANFFSIIRHSSYLFQQCCRGQIVNEKPELLISMTGSTFL